jgi:hypothetical protein
VRYPLLMPMMLLCPAIVAPAQVSIGINLPGVSIGINQPVYPDLVQVPGYPVYYAPGSPSNFFFYDGLYWVYQDNEWYSSQWYNGPWSGIQPYDVPVFLLRVPVRYYRQPPPYFGGWDREGPPRWGEHWGHDWERRRGGWDHWDHRQAPAPAPLPTYQRQFSGDRYPRPEQQQSLHVQNYHYQPREATVRAQYQQLRQQAPSGRGEQQQRGQAPSGRGGPGEQQQRGQAPSGRGGPGEQQQRGQAPSGRGVPVEQQQRGQAPGLRASSPAPQQTHGAPQGGPQHGQEPPNKGNKHESN